MKVHDRAPVLPAVEPLAEIEGMVLRLTELRQREPGKERRRTTRRRSTG